MPKNKTGTPPIATSNFRGDCLFDNPGPGKDRGDKSINTGFFVLR